MKMKKIVILLLLCGTVCLAFTAVAVSAEQSALEDKLIRIRVVANSDAPEDQRLKLLVRDRILSGLPKDQWQTREEAGAWLREHSERLCREAEAVLSEQGRSQDVTLTVSEKSCPTRTSGTIRLPAGDYLTAELRIGEGNGQNWWGILYPELCGAGVKWEDTCAFSKGETELLRQKTAGVQIKFLLVELLRGVSR